MKLIQLNNFCASHFTHNALDCVIFPIDTLHTQNMVAKVQCFEFPLLSQ